MPVKVRCSGCSKVLNAPDKARGKAIRCPDCQTVVRVPAQKKAMAERAAVPPPPSSSSIIANLDLQKYEETEHRICPRCGADVSPEDIECPKCEVMLDSGQLSEKKKKARARKGPDPAIYFKTLFIDAWRFLMDHKAIAFRTSAYSVLFSGIALGCLVVLLWCSRLPPKTFWGFCAFVVLMIPPGWAWYLNTVTITAALENKKKLPKKIRFDFFLCSALGIKVIAWTLAMGIPMHAVALVFLALKMPIWAASFSLFGLLFALLVFPVAMVHMSMVVTTPAWKFWVMDREFFRTILPSLYWVFFFVMTMLPGLAVAGTAVFLRGDNVRELAQTLDRNTRIAVAVELVNEAAASKNRTTKLPDEIVHLSNEQPANPEWSVIIIPSICWICASALFGFASVFNMRSNGLFAVYFRHRLDLITMVEEIKYVPKQVKDEEDEQKSGLTWAKLAIGIAIAIAFGTSAGAVYGMVSDAGLLLGLLSGIYWSVVVITVIGRFMLLGAAFQESTLWGMACFWLPFADIAFTIVHWNESKWGFALQMFGVVLVFFVFIIAIMTGFAFGILSGLGEAEKAANLVTSAISMLC